jgi:hypothetical protein
MFLIEIRDSLYIVSSQERKMENGNARKIIIEVCGLGLESMQNIC